MISWLQYPAILDHKSGGIMDTLGNPIRLSKSCRNSKMLTRIHTNPIKPASSLIYVKVMFLKSLYVVF